MAVKIQFRHGNAAAIPSLDTGEPGWDTDTKTIRVGDGTASPPRSPTTKSTGTFDFSGVTAFGIPRVYLGLGNVAAPSLYFSQTDPTTGLYSPGAQQVAAAVGGVQKVLITTAGVTITGDLIMSAGGKVDGIDLSLLNPANTTGIIVKTGNGSYAFRSLVPGAGIGPMVNGSSQANPGGVAGDITISIATNPTIPGNAAMKIPAGTTGERSGVSPVDGHLRYNSTTKAFEGRIDGEWRSLVDYVQGHNALVPSQFPSIQDAINYYANRSTKNNVNITLAAGTHLIDATLSAGSRTNRVYIIGAAPINVNLDANTPILSVSGSSGNYLVQYKLAGAVPTGITTDHSIIISDIQGSGDFPFFDYTNSNNNGLNVLGGALTEIVTRVTTADLTAWYQPNDYIMMTMSDYPVQLRKVNSITNANKMIADSALPVASNGRQYHRKLRRITGTISVSGTAVTGVGTSFLTELNVGDILISYTTYQVMRITAIADATHATISQATTTVTSEVALQFVHTGLHIGCWKIASIDTVAQTITVVNTTYNGIAPPKFGIRSGVINFMPTALLSTALTAVTLVDNEFIGLRDLTMRYTGSTPNNGPAAINNIGGEVSMNGLVGTVGMRHTHTSGATFVFNEAYFSGVTGANTTMLGFTSAAVNGTKLAVTGGAGFGIFSSHSDIDIQYGLEANGNGQHGAVLWTNTSMRAGPNCRVQSNGAGIFLQDSYAYMDSSNFASNSNDHVFGQNSTFSSAEMGLFFTGVSATGNGLNSTMDSMFNTLGTWAAGNKNAGIFHTTSVGVHLGPRVNNNGYVGIGLRFSAKFYQYGSGGVVANNNQHGIWGSDDCYAYTENFRFNGTKAGFGDIYMSNESKAYAYAPYKNDVLGVLTTSPPYNGVVGNRGSRVFSNSST